MIERQSTRPEPPTHRKEQTLIRRLQAGDHRAFEALVYRYSDRVYRQAHFILGSADEAEESCQDVFLQLYRKAHTFRGEAAFSTWFYRLTFNTILSRLQRQKRRTACLAHLKRFRKTRVISPEHLSVKTEIREHVQQAIDTLRPVDRAVVMLCDVEGVSNRDAGAILSLSVPAIKSRRHRARTQLRKLLAPVR